MMLMLILAKSIKVDIRQMKNEIKRQPEIEGDFVSFFLLQTFCLIKGLT